MSQSLVQKGTMFSLVGLLVSLLFIGDVSEAFAPSSLSFFSSSTASSTHASSRAKSDLKMGLDLVTYLRTEWISAAICSNQIPRSADVCLQLGTEDGRAVTFIPRTVRTLITSSAEPDGKLTVTATRQLGQQKNRREGSASISYVDQAADNLSETGDASVDVVISLQAAARMVENGLDWKKSIREAARVLRPGGRFIFVEQTEIAGESYLETVGTMTPLPSEATDSETEEEDETAPFFEAVGWDEVDLVLVPHVAGVFTKSEIAGMSFEDYEKKVAKETAEAEEARLAEISLMAFERGMKKRKRKKNKKSDGEEDEAST